MQMAPPSPPSCFPVLVISALRRLLPPLRSLCQARGRATVAGAPRPGAAAEPGAGCSQEDQKRSRRHPLLVLQHPQHPPPSAAALRTDGGGSCRGVCVRGEAVPGPRCPGAVSSSRDTAGEGGP